MKRRCVVSWSGGKDSALVLDRLRGRRPELEVVGLLTMFSPETGTSRSHGLPRDLVEAQARAWGLPLHVAEARWEDYERVFEGLVRERVGEGVEVIAFGDIFLDAHKEWVERTCSSAGAEAIEPLWGEDTRELANEVLERGYRPLVCTVRSDRFGPEWLGRPYDRRFAAEIERRGVDPCGEHGEFHTLVTGGSGMTRRLVIESAQPVTSAEHGHWVIDRWRVISI